MANQDLVNYIEQVRGQGVSDKEIKKTLLEKGWAEEDVNEGLKSTSEPQKTVVSEPTSPEIIQKEQPVKKPKPKYFVPVIVVVGVIVLGLVAWGVYSYLLKPDKSLEGEEATEGDFSTEPSVDLTKQPISKMMLYKGVNSTIPHLLLKVGFSGKRDSKYLLSVEHTQNASCSKKEILLPPDGSYSCDGKSSIFKLDAAGSNDNQVTFSIREGEVTEEPEIPKASEEIVDCGEVGPDKPDLAGERQSCFEAKFKECKPAKFIISVGLGPLGGGLVSSYYEIIGPSDNLCAVKWKYLKVPNPKWVNKEMICRYDNSMEFEEANQDLSKCQGELYDLMIGI